jgi:hypothetical protein
MEINKAIEKMMYKFKRLFRNRRYDVYCPYCTSCGETGCCSPTICINHPKGFYCERNMGDLRVSYYTLDKFWQWIYNNKESNEEVLNKLNEIYDKENDELEEYFKTLPEKLTITEKAQKWFNDYFLHIVVVLIFIGFISVLISALITKYK